MRISKDCKLWKVCNNKECVREFHMLYGKKIPKNATICWSMNICYALHDLMKNGLVKNNGYFSDIK